MRHLLLVLPLALAACADAELSADDPLRQLEEIDAGGPAPGRAPAPVGDPPSPAEPPPAGEAAPDLGVPPPAPEPEPLPPDAGVEPPPGPDAGAEPDPVEPDDLPPDPGVNAGWIGGPCAADSDCDYEEAFCLQDAEGYPRGMCSLGCDRICPDRDGMPVTFCIDEVIVGEGACVHRCDYDAFDLGCRPGYHCETRGRYSEPDTRRGVCVPGLPEEPEGGPLGCIEEMEAAGLAYQRTNNPEDHPAGRPDLVCDVDGPVRLSSPVGGIDYRYVSQDEPRPMFMSCHLANALFDLSELLRARGVVEVGHIGTYNCRTIADSDSISQHGLGMAIDLAWFRTADGRVYDIEDHWEHETENFRTEEGRWLWEVAQEMFQRQVFNTVLTPNFDAAHDNHFHVDLTPGRNIIRSGGHRDAWFGPNPHGD